MKLLKQAILFWPFLMVSFLAFGAQNGGDDARIQRYALSQRGHFELKVPLNWRAKVSQPNTQAPPAISFGPRKGKPFIITITPIWPTAKTKLPSNKDELRKRVEHDAGGIRLFAVEKDIKLTELEGASGAGFYFTATDQAPRAGGYKFMNKGGIFVGDLTVMFTILSNEGQELIVREALAMLQSASHVPAVQSKASTRQNRTSKPKP